VGRVARKIRSGNIESVVRELLSGDIRIDCILGSDLLCCDGLSPIIIRFEAAVQIGKQENWLG
jgi:hypothetical protein